MVVELDSAEEELTLVEELDGLIEEEEAVEEEAAEEELEVESFKETPWSLQELLKEE